MKVVEEGTDRSAEIHFYVEGSVAPLREYGEHVAADYAVCCYVPVEEGNKPKITGTFTGTTKEIACDAFVDGVHRRSVTYDTKDVQRIKRKIEFNTFLFMTENGIINSQMFVAPMDGLTAAKKSELDSRETVGTVEIRLYVMRQLDVFHESKDIMFDSPEKGRIVQYNRIPPTFQLDIERNSAPVTKQAESAFRRRMIPSRPGREPWAVFRFHYRSEEALEEFELPVTFDVKNKKLVKPQSLPLEPVPPLVADAETRQSENDGSHTPSPSLTETQRGESLSLKPSTPMQNASTAKPRLAMKTMSSAVRGIDCLKNRTFKKPSGMVVKSPPMVSTEGIDSLTSVCAIIEQSAATEVPVEDRDAEHESAPASAVSTKRSMSTMEETSPGPKRHKPLPIPTTPPSEPLAPQNTLTLDVSEAISPETRFFNYRKKLANLRKAWLEKDNELAAIKREMENYKLCMNEELERMRQEVLEEEDAFTEETKHCSSNTKNDSDISIQ